MVDKIDSSRDVIGANFQNTFFRINSGYVWGKGQNDKSYFNFRDEVVSVLSDLGFYADDKDKNSCFGLERGISAPTLHRDVDDSQTREKIYCHPMNLSGIILKDSVNDIAEALSKVEVFNLEKVNLFEQYIDYSENELITVLDSIRHPFLGAMVFESSKTTRKDKFVGTPETKVLEIISPIVGSMNKMSPVLFDYIREVKKDLIDIGLIVSHKSPDPDSNYFFRSLDKSELKDVIKNHDSTSLSYPTAESLLNLNSHSHEFKKGLYSMICCALKERDSLNITLNEDNNIDL